MNRLSISLLVMMGCSACEGNHSAHTRNRDSSKATKHLVDEGLAAPRISDTAAYLLSGNPDTALALFLYVDAYKYDYDLHKEEYIRWHTERSKIRRLYNHLFADRADREERLITVEKHSREFLKTAREKVFDDFKSSMS